MADSRREVGFAGAFVDGAGAGAAVGGIGAGDGALEVCANAGAINKAAAKAITPANVPCRLVESIIWSSELFVGLETNTEISRITAPPRYPLKNVTRGCLVENVAMASWRF
ncbi:MAG: hypothetical protein KGJ66_04150 [Alphaproteobacteria bacterium]|jgi:hypothetical protein|nr:hypothetical protein [Alphaproteobacteria bacterium]